MDMVAVQEADCKKDMEKEGLDLEINGDSFQLREHLLVEMTELQ